MTLQLFQFIFEINLIKALISFIQNKINIMSSVDKEALRTTHLSQSEAIKNKQRHGFFSVPISTAIGDDGQYKTKIHPRNEMGKPQTKPRNFQTNPTRSGQLAKSYLGPLNSLATTGKPDQYIEVPKRLIKEDHESRKLCPHQKQFFPQANYEILSKSAYPHIDENNPEKQPKRNRDDDGKVKSSPRQFQTNIQSHVISDYFKPIKYVSDPYERAHDIQWQRFKKQKAKEGEAVFRPNKFRSDSFNSSRAVFNDHQIKRTRYFHQTKFNITQHERRWRDTNANRKGLYGFFAPFPQYMENPPREIERREKSNDKDIFKAMNRSTVGIPSPSIAQNPTNLRRSLNHSFSHRPY